MSSSKFYPKAAGERAMIDSAMFYLIGTLYPAAGARHLSRARLPAISGRSRVRAMPSARQEARAQKAAVEAIAEPLEVFRKFYMDGKTFIGGANPSIADIRLASTLEFLRGHRLQAAGLGEAIYGGHRKSARQSLSEPAADVRGYIAYVKSQAK